MGATVAHIGMTVTDIEKVSEFYIKYFGFCKDYGFRFDEVFFRENNALFRQPDGTSVDMQMIKSPNGVMLELFLFPNVEQVGPAEWQRTGYSHIALRVDDLPALCERMKGDGVEFLMPVKERSGGGDHWVYLKDPDGNLVELWD